MRKLILLKGPPGAGKSTFARQMGWEPYTLSQDTLRLLRRAPELAVNGKMHISQEENTKVYREFLSLIEKRLERGEFLVLEGLFGEKPDEILEQAALHRYDVAVIDFSALPLEQILEQNQSRPDFRRVGDGLVEKVYRKMQHQADWGVLNIAVDPKGDFVKRVQQWVHVPVHDFSSFEEVVHIGDLQGCLSVLLDPQGPLQNQGFDPNKAYIFVGDLLDRGIENGALLKWFVEHALDLPNVFLIWGNHEDHLHRWAKGMPFVSDEFEQKTLPQLLEAGITQADAERVCVFAQEALFYTHLGRRVMVTHAGLPTVPAHPELISLRQYSKGTGNWSDPVDEQFERHAPSDWVQVHGHRNHGYQPIQARPRSFSLEDQVEFGGRLRWATLGQEGWTTGSVRNKVYQLDGSMKWEKKRMQWKSAGTTVSDATLAMLRGHEGVKEKIQPQGHISAFNFTKDVFYNASWDEVVVKARGFFINNQTNEIISRGYDKFFNINERPETNIDVLAENMAFPVIGYLKENGYLGNVGYDSHTGELFVATKSSSGGDFSDWFRTILAQYLSPTMEEGLARYLRDNEACLTFEVIDPVNDPHMIAYDKPQLVLLDMFHRNERTERLDYEELKAVGKKFNLPVKGRGIVLHDKDALVRWHDKVSKDLSWRYHGKDIEGLVLEDQRGFMTKIKMPHYAFWKKMRSHKDRMKREWDKVVLQGEQRNQRLERDKNGFAPRFDEARAKEEFVAKWNNLPKEHEASQAFLSWCAEQDPSMWSKSIIELREEFLKTPYPQHVWSIPFEQYSSKPDEPVTEPPSKRPSP